MAQSGMTFAKTVLAALLAMILAIFVSGAIVVIMVFTLIASSLSQDPPSIASGSVLLIDLSGSINEGASDLPFASITGSSDATTIRDITRGLEYAAGDDKIGAVVLELGGFGGNWAQAEEIRSAITAFSRSNKLIIATSGGTGFDERSYLVASACDSIACEPSAVLELNGLAATLTFFHPLLERIGVQAEVVRAGSYKSAVEPFLLDSASAENLEMTRSILSSLSGNLYARIAEARRLDTARLARIMSEKLILEADEARSEGLVDLVIYRSGLDSLIARRSAGAESTRPAIVKLDEYTRSIPAENESDDDTDSSGTIALIHIVGGIAIGESGFDPNPLFGGETSGSETFANAIRDATDNSSVKVIVIRMDSPGGAVSACDAMWQNVKLATAKKPVIVSMGGTAASAAYYIAAAADTIVADKTTITGSIGVFGLFFNTRELLRRELGINTQTLTTAPSADMFSGQRRMTDMERRVLEQMVDTTYARFISVVSSGRGLSLDSTRAIAGGRVWTGEQALSLGLVDIIGGLDHALDIAAQRAGISKGNFAVRLFPQPRSWIERVAERFGALSQSSPYDLRSTFEHNRILLESFTRWQGVQGRSPVIDIR